ncbi:MAG: hypothetical protein R3282_02220 [Rhodothermales bacterium]|nr:hypothetical protein [Rhodothermales bacterium]
MGKDADLERLMKEIRDASETMRAGEPEDITRLRRLPGAMGQSLTITMFGFQEANAIKSNVNFLLRMADKYDEPWVSVVASELLAAPVKALGKRYQMTDTAALLERASRVAAGVSGEELVSLLRRLLEYSNFLSRRLRDLLPFHELSVTFEGYRYMTEKAIPPSKGRPRERA